MSENYITKDIHHIFKILHWYKYTLKKKNIIYKFNYYFYICFASKVTIKNHFKYFKLPIKVTSVYCKFLKKCSVDELYFYTFHYHSVNKEQISLVLSWWLLSTLKSNSIFKVVLFTLSQWQFQENFSGTGTCDYMIITCNVIIIQSLIDKQTIK